jgi:hypothetical protein
MRSIRIVKYIIETEKETLKLSPKEYNNYKGYLKRGTLKEGYKPKKITIIRVKANKKIFEKRNLKKAKWEMQKNVI